MVVPIPMLFPLLATASLIISHVVCKISSACLSLPECFGNFISKIKLGNKTGIKIRPALTQILDLIINILKLILDIFQLFLQFLQTHSGYKPSKETHFSACFTCVPLKTTTSSPGRLSVYLMNQDSLDRQSQPLPFVIAKSRILCCLSRSRFMSLITSIKRFGIGSGRLKIWITPAISLDCTFVTQLVEKFPLLMPRNTVHDSLTWKAFETFSWFVPAGLHSSFHGYPDTYIQNLRVCDIFQSIFSHVLCTFSEWDWTDPITVNARETF